MAKPVLDTPDRNKVVALLTQLGTMAGGPRDRRSFVQGAGLAMFIPLIQWEGNDAAVAGNLVDSLNSYGFLIDSPNYHALAKLFAYCLDNQLVGLEDAQYLASLIVKYGLVRDPAYVENLRRTYGIAEERPVHTTPPVAPSGEVRGQPAASGGVLTADASPTQIREALIQRFSLEELRTLCFDINVDFDSLAGEGKSGKARELVAHMQRRSRLPGLVDAINRAIEKEE